MEQMLTAVLFAHNVVINTCWAKNRSITSRDGRRVDRIGSSLRFPKEDPLIPPVRDICHDVDSNGEAMVVEVEHALHIR